jgi:hypothetical protein
MNSSVIIFLNLRREKMQLQHREGSPSSTVCIAPFPLGMDFGERHLPGVWEYRFGMPDLVGVYGKKPGGKSEVHLLHREGSLSSTVCIAPFS